jgi:hypothetical protein
MPLPIRSIVLNIRSCMECPKHQMIQDPDPTQPGYEDAIAVVCTLSPNPERNLTSLQASDHSPHRPVVATCRPQHVEREAEVPDWCPLLHKNLFGIPGQ